MGQLRQDACSTPLSIGHEVFKGTIKVDFERVKREDIRTLPELNLEVDSGLTKDEKIIEIAQRVSQFKHHFRHVLIGKLTETLIDSLAWSYMPSALVKTGFSQEFKRLIGEYPLEERTWT